MSPFIGQSDRFRTYENGLPLTDFISVSAAIGEIQERVNDVINELVAAYANPNNIEYASFPLVVP